MRNIGTRQPPERMRIMGSHRVERLNEDFKREISDILPSMKDARINEMLSVIRAQVTSDLSYAKIYVSSLKGFEQAKEACAALNAAQGYIKTSLAKRLRIRKIPNLSFIADDSVDYYYRIQGILEGEKHEH